MKMKTVGLYAGSFDPLTNGHLDIIKRASKLFDTVIVALGINPSKKYTFSEEERISLINEACSELEGIKVVSMGNDLLVHFAKSVGATHIVRGIRSHKDFDDESLMQRINKDLDSSAETVFFIPNKEFIDVSSSLVKMLVGPKYWHYAVSKYVPKNVLKHMARKNIENVFLGKHMNLSLDSVLGEILEKYGDSNRHYHNEFHLVDMFQEYERVKNLFNVSYGYNILLAILMHDVENDEKESCDFFLEKSKSIVFPYYQTMHSCIRNEVVSLIMATDHSREDFENFTNDQKLIHDMDFMILASDPDIYKQYSKNIYEEYSTKVDKKTYCLKRKAFLEKMLKREKLFLHEAFFEYEEKARTNIKAEINQL